MRFHCIGGPEYCSPHPFHKGHDHGFGWFQAVGRWLCEQVYLGKRKPTACKIAYVVDRLLYTLLKTWASLWLSWVGQSHATRFDLRAPIMFKYSLLLGLALLGVLLGGIICCPCVWGPMGGRYSSLAQATPARSPNCSSPPTTPVIPTTSAHFLVGYTLLHRDLQQHHSCHTPRMCTACR